MGRTLLLSLVAMVLASPTAAQDGSEASGARTPENAQRFLAVMAQQYPLLVTPTYGWGTTANLTYKVTSVASDDRCTSRIDGTVQTFQAMDANGNSVFPPGNDYSNPDKHAELFAARQDLVTLRNIRTGPYDIDWSRVSFVGEAQYYNQQKNAYEPVKGTALVAVDKLSIVFMPPNPELAGRLLLALQTLKQACDKTEGLGF